MSLPKIFDEVLSRELPVKPKTGPVFKIKPSMLGSKCLRKGFYSATDVTVDFPFPLDGKRRMKLGDAVHDMLEDVFTSAGILIKYKHIDGSILKDFNGNDDNEFPISSEDLFIKRGKIDAVLLIDGKLWLGEYKSINKNGFESLRGPKDDHKIQSVIYLYIFNKLLSEGKYSHIPELAGFTKAEGIRILYVNKDDTTLKEFTLCEADDLFTHCVRKIMEIKAFSEAKVLPPKTQDFCHSCNWRTKCAKNQIE